MISLTANYYNLVMHNGIEKVKAEANQLNLLITKYYRFAIKFSFLNFPHTLDKGLQTEGYP